ncbi:cobalamin biosynthesis protein CobD [Kribbella flavida DSM 17836]|uniref:Cobalamin biosynthesis protein CobD n=1 Tax=Kribbella flavida (strain DSM 17836 / JCM 10339 / NBRC 14399) TaxID=479435 RepID=D2Q357_KRIFD|nr:cobalamin biosynthesis protein [Kribbella flavida]ADB32182.1 cobalamin biosynthesis protein CobD [Kribbella flavida DSM 17836]
MSRALGLILGFAADRLLGDPRRFHPVAGFGRAATRVEAGLYADSRAAGTAYAAVLVGSVTAAGLVAERLTTRRPVARTLLTAATTWAVVGGRSLEREAAVMSGLLEAKNLPAARDRLSHLCSRDATDLQADELARATVESIAENTSDATVAPLIWGGLFGIPGLVGYRAANTLDAMVGYRSAKYRNFGWAAARFDDLVNLVPARVCAVLTGLMSGRPRVVRRIWRRDAGKHPSPNAGPVEASFAGALDLRLGGTNTYRDEVEDRGTLGDGLRPGVSDVRRTAVLARRVSYAAAATAAILALAANEAATRRAAGPRRAERGRR